MNSAIGVHLAEFNSRPCQLFRSAYSWCRILANYQCAVRVVEQLNQIGPPEKEHRLSGGENHARRVLVHSRTTVVGPSEVLDQSNSRHSARISPGPSKISERLVIL